MKRISFNRRFVNATGDDLVPGKIHTIRQNYEYWKRFEGREAALFTWEGKPYRSKQQVFCVKRIVSVQKVTMNKVTPKHPVFFIPNGQSFWDRKYLSNYELCKNDGLSFEAFNLWFSAYPEGDMAIIHFTDCRY
jgi:hypothetical protein